MYVYTSLIVLISEVALKHQGDISLLTSEKSCFCLKNVCIKCDVKVLVCVTACNMCVQLDQRYATCIGLGLSSVKLFVFV